MYCLSSENPEACCNIELCDREVSPPSAGFLLGLLFDPEDGDELSSEMSGVTTQKAVLFILTSVRTSNPT
jgi:hypothetical protein